MAIIVDLPFPISVNRIWRGSGRHVYRSKEYMAWINQAGLLWNVQKRGGTVLPSKGYPKSVADITPIKGVYSLHIIFHPPDKRRRDIGNLEKVCSDFIQSVGLIEDDHYCRELHLVYGSSNDAPYGARLTIESV